MGNILLRSISSIKVRGGMGFSNGTRNKGYITAVIDNGNTDNVTIAVKELDIEKVLTRTSTCDDIEINVYINGGRLGADAVKVKFCVSCVYEVGMLVVTPYKDNELFEPTYYVGSRKDVEKLITKFEIYKNNIY